MSKEFESYRLQCEYEKLIIQPSRKYTLTGKQYIDMIDAFIKCSELIDKLEKENEELKIKSNEVIYKEKIIYRKR